VSAACPDATHDYAVTDSDELLAIELSDPRHHFRTGFQKGSIKDVVTWAEQFADSRQAPLERTTLACGHPPGMPRAEIVSAVI
jgi:hypothetical protein